MFIYHCSQVLRWWIIVHSNFIVPITMRSLFHDHLVSPSCPTLSKYGLREDRTFTNIIINMLTFFLTQWALLFAKMAGLNQQCFADGEEMHRTLKTHASGKRVVGTKLVPPACHLFPCVLEAGLNVNVYYAIYCIAYVYIYKYVY